MNYGEFEHSIRTFSLAGPQV